MQTALYKYLALYKNLNIPGIGNFAVKQTAPQLQFTDKKIEPPQTSVSFTPVVHPTNNHFYTFLSREWGVDKVIAIRKYKDEVENLLEELKHKKVCELEGIGTLHKNGDDNIAFTAAEQPFCFYPILKAERVVRKNAQHTVLIGEQEHIKEYNAPEVTTEQEIVYEETETKGKWKVYALIIAIAAVLLIVLYYVMYSGS